MSKASKQRPCPALGRAITPGECGGQRQSRIPCPGDCPHNPFGPANYSQLLEIEDRLDPKTMERLLVQAPDRAALQTEIARAHRQGTLATQAFYVWNLFFARDADGLTFARRWEENCGSELKNDERVLLRGKMQMRLVLLEIHRVQAGGRVEAVDLLSPEPEPMLVLDRSLAGSAARFLTLLTWVLPLPHYWHMSGTATPIPDLGDLTAPEVVREIVRHLGGPLTEAEMRHWLAEHFLRFNHSLQAALQLRHEQTLTAMDVKAGKAVYELRAPFAQCRDRLDAVPDLEPEDLTDDEQNEGFAEAREWLDPEPMTRQLTMPGGRMVLGRVLLGQSLWRLEAVGTEKFARLRRLFEQQLGGLVRFASERVDDLGARQAVKGPAVNQTLVPPRLLEHPDQYLMASSRMPAPPPGLSKEEAVQAMMRSLDQAFLDEQVPALNHHTPREAARDPALRPKLIQLMKARVRTQDERNLEMGDTEDINWMLRELGLTEITFDPPPWRPPPPPSSRMPPPVAEAGDWPAPDGFEEKVAVDPNRPPAPLLPKEPLSIAEASERLQNSLGMFETAGDAELELMESGATLLEDADQFLPASLTENDYAQATVFMLHAWFALVPPGCRAPEIDAFEFERRFVSNLRQLEDCFKAGTAKKLEAFLSSGAQPNLMLILLSGFLETTMKAKDLRPSLEAQPIILALLKAEVEVVDQALRQK